MVVDEIGTELLGYSEALDDDKVDVLGEATEAQARGGHASGGDRVFICVHNVGQMWRRCNHRSQPLGRASSRLMEGPAPVSRVGVISRIRASSQPRDARMVNCRYTGAKTRCTRIIGPCGLGAARGGQAASGTLRATFPARPRKAGLPADSDPIVDPRARRRRARLR